MEKEEKMTSAVIGDIMVHLENPTVKWIAVGGAVTSGAYLAIKFSWFRKNPFHSFSGKTGALAKDLVDGGIQSYNKFFDQEDGKGVGDRILSTPDFVNKFYSLITDFYEYGWGESFHFAAREIGESFEASIIRQETGEFFCRNSNIRCSTKGFCSFLLSSSHFAHQIIFFCTHLSIMKSTFTHIEVLTHLFP